MHIITKKNICAPIVENRLMEVPPHQMLPLMYLIDSMCRKLPHYSLFFASNLVSNFAFVFQRVSLEDRFLLHQLRVSWDQIFAPNILHFLAKSFFQNQWSELSAQRHKCNAAFLSCICIYVYICHG